MAVPNTPRKYHEIPQPLELWRNSFGKQLFIQQPEDRRAFHEHRLETVEMLRPVGKEEEMMAELTAQALWLLYGSIAAEVNFRALAGAELARAIRKEREEDQPELQFNAYTLAISTHFEYFGCGPKEPEKKGGPQKLSGEWLGRHRYRLERAYSKHRADLKQLQKERFAFEKEQWELKLKYRDEYDAEKHGPFQSKTFDAAKSPGLSRIASESPVKMEVAMMTRYCDVVADAKRGDRDDITRIRWFQGKCEHEMKLDFDTGDPEAGLAGERRRKEREEQERRDRERE